MQDMLKFLKEHDHYIILTHSLPDGDALGSAAGLCLGLRRLGKTAYVGCNPDITPMYRPFVQDFLAPTSYKHDTVVAVDTAGRKLIPECWRAWAVGAKIDHHPLASESDYADVTGGSGLRGSDYAYIGILRHCN